jgi:hypothetical protein
VCGTRAKVRGRAHEPLTLTVGLMAFFGITSLGPPNVFELYRCGGGRAAAACACPRSARAPAIGSSCSQQSVCALQMRTARGSPKGLCCAKSALAARRVGEHPDRGSLPGTMKFLRCPRTTSLRLSG